MIDWQKKTWQPGAKARYHQGHGREPMYYEVHAGLYWYAGLGCGNYFRGDGTMLWCSPSEAQAEAQRLGETFRYVDSFVVSSFSSVMG
jgi:hypothetical protein